jgi:hypothetical protein
MGRPFSFGNRVKNVTTKPNHERRVLLTVFPAHSGAVIR